MKKLILTLTGVFCAVSLFAQGQIQLNNRITGSIVAPVFGPQIGNPTLEIHGNTATGTPPGATTYNSSLLIWNNSVNQTLYMAQFFGGPLGTDDAALAPLTPTAGFRTFSAGAGFVQAPADAVVVPGVPTGSSARLQLRAWDTRGGTITSWADAIAAAANGSLLIGDSLSFDSPALGGGPISPPAPIGLTSFNLHFVPEPSVIALGVLGVGALVLFRRRKN